MIEPKANNVPLDQYLSYSLEAPSTLAQCRIISLTGRLDTNNSLAFTREIDKIMPEVNIFIFNFKALDYISSTGIGSFVHILKELRSRNGTLVFYNASDKVWKAFELLGFNELFPRKKNREEALAYAEELSKETPTVFPLKVACPGCNRIFSISKPGNYRCSSCKDVFAVAPTGKILYSGKV